MSNCCENKNSIRRMELNRIKMPEEKENCKNGINFVIKGACPWKIKILFIIKMVCDYCCFKDIEMFKIMDFGRNGLHIQIFTDFIVISTCVICTILDCIICSLKYLNCICCYLLSVHFYRYNCLLKSVSVSVWLVSSFCVLSFFLTFLFYLFLICVFLTSSLVEELSSRFRSFSFIFLILLLSKSSFNFLSFVSGIICLSFFSFSFFLPCSLVSSLRLFICYLLFLFFYFLRSPTPRIIASRFRSV